MGVPICSNVRPKDKAGPPARTLPRLIVSQSRAIAAPKTMKQWPPRTHACRETIFLVYRYDEIQQPTTRVSAAFEAKWSLIAVIVASAVRGVAQNQNGSVPRCYYPNGQTATNDCACYLNTTQSFCCTEGVKCLKNKICDFINPTEYRFNRGTCTDKTWTSPACPSFGQDYGSGVVKCPGTTKVCCDNGNNDSNATCCFDPSLLFDMPSGWEAFPEIDSSAETAVVNLQTSQTASATTSAAEDATSSSSQGGSDASVGTATIVGAAVGGVAGVAVLNLLALLYLKRRKRPGRGMGSGFAGSRLGLWMRKK
ncbi:hypothetical protein IWX90DRAFT_419483 [Phyllosticta citrichinensis]|uniref:Uncharacterized protein n=1 Tax=Phyllosticta citrichinensis TaxID=1130410 RepID=A0ABR1XEQ2_9PEZI